MILKTFKKDRRIMAFIGTNSGQVFYAFGKPTQQGGYIAFNVNDIETAEQRINEQLY